MNKPMGCLLCLLLAGQAGAADDTPAAAKKKAKRPAPTVIENCVDASHTLSFREGDSGTILDEVDRFLVAGEIVRRYPMIERDGFYPTAIALWRRKEGDWVFATLTRRSEAPQRLCFSANVAVGQVQIAPALLKKYFGISPAPI
ncbi:MAG TPA: hypothetical protein VFL64_12165 [Rhizobacter sp.]|nr:hypothetical protein [Rhizobacter sp.]